MRHPFHSVSLTTLAVIALTTLPVAAQQHQDWDFDGDFQLGYRFVDVDGSETKYREDIDLEEGPRLFTLDFDLVAPKEMRDLFDRIEIDLKNLGGDPFETIHARVKKYGHYSLTIDRRSSSYFYNDIILPHDQSSYRLSNVGDLHHFNFDRVQDKANLTLWFGSAAQLDLGFETFRKRGERTTTLDIHRDEFELHTPIDESMSEYRAAFSYDWSRATLVFEGKKRDFENIADTFLLGYSEGENPTNETNLMSYFLSQPYDISSLVFTTRLVAHPSDRLCLRFTVTHDDQSMNLAMRENALGTSYTGETYESSSHGQAEVDRDMAFANLGLEYRITDRLALVAGARSQTLDQTGDLSIDDELGETSWDVDTTSLELGFHFDPTNDLTLSAGLVDEKREVSTTRESQSDGLHSQDEKASNRGYYLSLGWRPSREFRLNARFNDGTYDDPYTLSSPTSKLAYRVSASYGRPVGFSVSGSLRGSRQENDGSGWKSDFDSLNLRLGYRGAGVSVSAGFTLVEFDREIDQTVQAGSELFFPIAYLADSDFWDLRVVWAATTRLKLGAESRFYDNSGSFSHDRSDLRGFAEIGLGDRYVAHISYRKIDYDEKRTDFDDYGANIGVVSFGYRW